MTLHNPLEKALAQIPVAEQALTVAGASTHVWIYGPADASTTYVLVHGFRGTHHGLLSLIAAMPEARFIAPDLPGFGDSGVLPGGHDLDAYAQWLADLVRIYDPQGETVLLGHSFGSLIVARSVRSLAPRRIVLVNPISENALQGPDRLLTGIAVGYYRVGAALPKRAGELLLGARPITRIMSETMAMTRSRALRQWVHQQHDTHFSSFANRRALLEAFEASVSDEVRTHAAEFPPGTQLVVGEKDAIAPLAASRRLHAAMPGSTLHVIGGVGHLVHYEAPLALARILRERIG